MANGSLKPIEAITAGEYVDTLEGPRRVIRQWPKRFDSAVKLTVGDYSQVQSRTHQVFSGEAWVSLCDLFASKNDQRADRLLRQSWFRSQDRQRSVLGSFRRFAQRIGSYLEQHRQSSLATVSYAWQSGQESDFSESSNQREAVEQHLSSFDPPAQQSPYRALLAPTFSLPSWSCGVIGVLKQSSLQDWMDHCLAYSRQYGGRILELVGLHSDKAVCPVWLHRSSDAERPSPIHSLDDVSGRTPKCSAHKSSYLHPYTQETRSIDSYGDFAFSTFKPVGSVELFDLEIDGANHYITGPGLVNKNCFDEATNFLESQVRFLLGWLRTIDSSQKCQALFTFNPPTSAEGQWVIPFFAPWLDKNHPNPAKAGELRWFASIDGKDVEVESGESFTREGEMITPKSRTFIPSRVTDNPYLMSTGYMNTLQALPEPLRSQMLNGDFNAGMEDDPFQVIPTKWVEMAMQRWSQPARLEPMDSLGVDVARGGRDNTVLARRHNMWFDLPLTYPGTQTPDGPTTAGLVIASMRDKAPIHIDVIGVGAAPYDFLKEAGQQVIGVNVSESPTSTDKSGLLSFFNLRSELWWKMREALDPAANTGIILPNDTRLKADLCAPKWKLKTSGKIQVESRDEIVSRIGRSPDFASAYILALMTTAKRAPPKPVVHLYSGGASSWMG
jgi:hypothetical protein